MKYTDIPRAFRKIARRTGGAVDCLPRSTWETPLPGRSSACSRDRRRQETTRRHDGGGTSSRPWCTREPRIPRRRAHIHTRAVVHTHTQTRAHCKQVAPESPATPAARRHGTTRPRKTASETADPREKRVNRSQASLSRAAYPRSLSSFDRLSVSVTRAIAAIPTRDSKGGALQTRGKTAEGRSAVTAAAVRQVRRAITAGR